MILMVFIDSSVKTTTHIVVFDGAIVGIERTTSQIQPTNSRHHFYLADDLEK
jgi:hypothetical protein